MIQYRRFALDLQRYADQCLTDDDITAAQVLDDSDMYLKSMDPP